MSRSKRPPSSLLRPSRVETVEAGGRIVPAFQLPAAGSRQHALQNPNARIQTPESKRRCCALCGDGRRNRLAQIRSRHFRRSAFHTRSPFHPLVRDLEQEAGFRRRDDVSARLEKLTALLEGQAPPTLQVLADLLSLPSEERIERSKLSPMQPVAHATAQACSAFLERTLAGACRDRSLSPGG